jgi:hypothetical protein
MQYMSYHSNTTDFRFMMHVTSPKEYYVDNSEVEEFDKEFPQTEKLKLPGQLF